MSQQPWKASVFNVEASSNGKTYFFNSVSGRMFGVPHDRATILRERLAEVDRNGGSDNPKLLECLVQLGFVVDRATDEYQRERARFRHTVARHDVLKVVLAPTMRCNLHCSYCFQQELARAGTMAPEIVRGVVEFVQRKAVGAKLLVVQWFGGEPLLAFQAMRDMSDAFQRTSRDQGADYYAELLTNGTLLTKERIAELGRMSVRAVQIAVDGSPATYALRKGMALSQAEDFYRRLFDHMPLLLDTIGSVTIRVNVDRDNPEGGQEMVRLFQERGIVDRRLDFRLGYLNTSRGVIECIPHDCLAPTEFDHAECEFRGVLARAGYRVYGKPERRNFPCSACLANSFTIDPNGRIGKCVPAMGTAESVFGQIFPEDIDRSLREVEAQEGPYGRYDPYASGSCVGCALLPACLGSCPKMHEPGHHVLCALKQGLSGWLPFYSGYNDKNERGAP